MISCANWDIERMKLGNATQKGYYRVVQRSKEIPFETAIIEYCGVKTSLQQRLPAQ